MGAVLFGLAQLLAPALADPVWRYGAVAALIGAGIVSYFGIGAGLGAFRLSDFKGLRRQR
jgi:putative peptidoglycan lipid II flippase